MQSNKIKIFPGSNNEILGCSPWVNLVEYDSATELWVDISFTVPENLEYYIQNNCIDKVVFYDWFHTKRELDKWVVEFLQWAQVRFDCVLYTLNVLPLPIEFKQQRFDYFWNRCKSAYLDKVMRWHQLSNKIDYQQYPIHLSQRSHKFLNLTGRPDPYRQRLYEHLAKYTGYQSNWVNNIFLESNSNKEQFRSGAVLPAQHFLDSS